MPYRADIDGLRAVAVLAVVVFHANASVLPGGFVGVDVFFVISGFLITSILHEGLADGSLSIARFYAHRIKRLAPALAVMLAAVWAVGWQTLLTDEYQQLGAHILSGAAFVMNLTLWNEIGYFDEAAHAKPLLHLWSLGVEEQFYLVWPILLRLCWRRIPLLVVAAATVVLSFGFNIAVIGDSPAAAFYLPFGRLWQMGAGALLALWCADRGQRTPSGTGATVASLVGLAAIVAAYRFYSAETPYPGWAAVAPTAGAALVIAGGPAAWPNRVLLANRAAVWVGLVSYPLYLWHWPLLTMLRNVSGGDLGTPLLVGALLLSLVLAWATRRFVEVPVRAMRAGASSRWATATMAMLLAAVGGAGYYVWARGSDLPPRFAGRLAALAEFSFSHEAPYRQRDCYLMEDQPPGDLAEECVETTPRGAPLLLVWGDSHAAHLVPGLQRLTSSRGLRLAQVTSARCPPILGASNPDEPNCPSVNEFVLANLRRWRPSTVVIAARWVLYEGALERLGPTLQSVRRASRARIVLVGPVPNWTGRLPRVLFNFVQRRPFAETPDRLPVKLAGSVSDLDVQMRAVAARHRVDYASPFDALCDWRGCLAAIGGDPSRLIAWDESHLTSDGSVLLVNTLADRLHARAATAAGRRSKLEGGERRRAALFGR